MTIIDTALYLIDHIENKVTNLHSKANQDLENYLKELIERISNGNNKRRFEFRADTTEVKKTIDDIIRGGDFLQLSKTASQRLLVKEQVAQKEVQQLKIEIQKGILLTALVEYPKSKVLILSKADHSDFIDEKELRIRKGLSIKHKIYKALLIEFSLQNKINKLEVYDTNASIAKYWWDDFLELNEINTNQYNTEKAFKEIDRLLTQRVKEKFPSDHNILRNRTLGYFKSHKNFKIESFINNAFGEYEPVNSEFDIQSFKNKLLELPQLKSFDSQFTITKEVIKARSLRNIVPLSENIELHMLDNIPDLDKIIKPKIISGQKYIQIRTDKGYDVFQK